jgi:hypothetical protein
MLKKRSLPPDQSRSAKRTSRGNLSWLLAAAILFPLAGAFLASEQGPLLLRDFSMGENLRPADQSKIVSARCRSRLVLYSCEVKASVSGHEMELKYMFADWPFAQHSVRLLQKISDPAVLTTDLGQQILLNRAIFLGVILLFCFAMPVVYLRARRRSRLELQKGL